MKTALILSLFVLIFCQSGRSQTNMIHLDVLRLRDGDMLTNASIKRLNSAYAIVYLDTGGERVAITNLPPEIQKELGFDPAKAQAELEDEQQLKVATAKAVQDADRDRVFRYVDGNLVPIAEFKNLRGKVSRIASDGIFLSPIVEAHYAASPGFLTGNQTFGAYIPGGETTHSASPKRGPHYEKLVSTVFIKCPTAGIADGELWTGLCYKSGTVSDRGRTIAQYDTGTSYKTKSDAVLHR